MPNGLLTGIIASTVCALANAGVSAPLTHRPAGPYRACPAFVPELMEPLQASIQALEPYIDVLLSTMLAETVRSRVCLSKHVLCN